MTLCLCRTLGWTAEQCDKLAELEDEPINIHIAFLARQPTNRRYDDSVVPSRHWTTTFHPLFMGEYMRVGLIVTNVENCIIGDDLEYFKLVSEPKLDDFLEPAVYGEDMRCLQHIFEHHRRLHAVITVDITFVSRSDVTNFASFRDLSLTDLSASKVINYYRASNLLRGRLIKWVEPGAHLIGAINRVTVHRMVCYWGVHWISEGILGHLPELQAFERDPVRYLRKWANTSNIQDLMYPKHFLPERLLLELVLLGDGLLRLQTDDNEDFARTQRFYKIAQRLPYDVQGYLCRVVQSRYWGMRMISNWVYGPALSREWYIFMALEPI